MYVPAAWCGEDEPTAPFRTGTLVVAAVVRFGSHAGDLSVPSGAVGTSDNAPAPVMRHTIFTLS